MSAFIVSDHTMQRVVRGMYPAWCSSDAFSHYGRELYRLNAEAMRVRYGHDPADYADLENWEYNPCLRICGILDRDDIPENLAEACGILKAMHCLLYQCSEGEQLTEQAAYKALQKRIHLYEATIVDRLPEYDAAPWDYVPVAPAIAPKG